MNEIYLINYFDKKKLTYKGTINAGFKTEESARKYAAKRINEKYKLIVFKVPLH